MGLFSKIFGGTPEEQGEASDEAAAAPTNAPERSRAREAAHEAHGRESAHAQPAAPREPSPPVAPHANVAGRPAARPSLSANVGARVHQQPTATSPTVAVKTAAEAPPPPAAQRQPVKRVNDVSPSPPPAQVAPPPKPVGATSRAPVPPASRAPAKKVAMTATLPLGTSAPQKAPKPAGTNGATHARASEALVLEPLAAPPPAPEPLPAGTDDVDQAFDRIAPAAVTTRGLPGALVDDAVVKAENAKLFAQMVVEHARPLREFILELTVGATTKQWLDVARPAADSIAKGAKALDQSDLEKALADFQKAMNQAATTPGSKIDRGDRAQLLSTYEKLALLLPSAFEVKGDRDRREALVVHHLLLQVPGVHKVTLDKLYSAGLASLEALCRSSVEDLVAIGHVEMESASAIIRRFQSYWRERSEKPLQKAEESVKRKLRELVDELCRAHEDFQRAEDKEDKEGKRRARNARRERALAMNVLLAQLGEVDLVEELERSPTEKRISRVQSYIEHSSANHLS